MATAIGGSPLLVLGSAKMLAVAGAFPGCAEDGSRALRASTADAPLAWGAFVMLGNLLAASVSEALIRIGVRAVVAAGWAVNDDAAQYFARQFYGLMLSGAGYRFGRAIYEARRYLLGHPDFGPTTTR